MENPDIAKQCGVDISEIQHAVDFIKTLHPKPGTLVGGDKPTTIIPDLIVEKVEDEFVVMLNDRSVPCCISINPTPKCSGGAAPCARK